jgi:hypothetical protein
VKRFKFTKKRVLTVLSVAAVMAVAGIAYAYFTSSGSGSGTASVGTSTAFVLHGTTDSALYPGTNSTVTFTVDNNGSGNQNLSTIHLDSITAYPTEQDRTDGTNAIAGCGSIDDGSVANAQTSDFYMADVTVGNDYAPGSDQAVTPTGTLVMNDLASSQDDCKNAFLKLNLSSS